MTVTNLALSKEVESNNMFLTPAAKKKGKIGAKKKQVQIEPPPPPKKPEKKVPEGRKYAQIAPESIKIKGECVGVDDLDDAVAKALSEEVSYRLREIISKSTIYMRQTKSTKLSRAHLKSVFVANDLEYNLGHLTPPSFNLLEGPEIFVQLDSTDNLEEMVDPNEELEQFQPKIAGKIVLPDKRVKPADPNKKTTNGTESLEGKTVVPVVPDKQSKSTAANKKQETEPLEALGLRKVAKS
ncbi:uncharacterized protein LOC126184581 [Schistocerca cancellata]|uniref:uncharacterized protein LOC126184581 n=1 Tax=Schistocerca cancellata TaxID=274614 RepID=UPI002117BFBD|nr:uncharacterized protein LOC126184581 [Schistocerca cancellata]